MLGGQFRGLLFEFPEGCNHASVVRVLLEKALVFENRLRNLADIDVGLGQLLGDAQPVVFARQFIVRFLENFERLVVAGLRLRNRLEHFDCSKELLNFFFGDVGGHVLEHSKLTALSSNQCATTKLQSEKEIGCPAWTRTRKYGSKGRCVTNYTTGQPAGNSSHSSTCSVQTPAGSAAPKPPQLPHSQTIQSPSPHCRSLRYRPPRRHASRP